VLLALVGASLISFPSFPSTSMFTSHPATVVNRALKGDRLPTVHRTAWPLERRWPASPAKSSQSPGKIPVGCEAAFSPISAPQLGGVFRRCVV
jgi:hypothetical protein